MEEYRFIIRTDGEVQKSDLAFQKKAYERYLELNGLIEENIMDSYTEWENCWVGTSMIW